MKVHTFNEGDLAAELGLTVGVPILKYYIYLWKVAKGDFWLDVGQSLDWMHAI